jgi:hypothetical protein
MLTEYYIKQLKTNASHFAFKFYFQLCTPKDIYYLLLQHDSYKDLKETFNGGLVDYNPIQINQTTRKAFSAVFDKYSGLGIDFLETPKGKVPNESFLVWEDEFLTVLGNLDEVYQEHAIKKRPRRKSKKKRK